MLPLSAYCLDIYIDSYLKIQEIRIQSEDRKGLLPWVSLKTDGALKLF